MSATTERSIYARMSLALSMLPASTQQLAEAIGVRQDTVRDWMRFARSQGIVRVVARRRDEGLVYGLHDGPGYKIGGRPMPDNLARFCAAWHALRRRMSSGDLAQHLGVSDRTSSHILREMRRRGMARIAGWECRGQTLAPLYDRLPTADAPRPPRIDRSERNAAYWAERRERLASAGLSTRERLPEPLRVRVATTHGAINAER